MFPQIVTVGLAVTRWALLLAFPLLLFDIIAPKNLIESLNSVIVDGFTNVDISLRVHDQCVGDEELTTGDCGAQRESTL